MLFVSILKIFIHRRMKILHFIIFVLASPTCILNKFTNWLPLKTFIRKENDIHMIKVWMGLKIPTLGHIWPDPPKGGVLNSTIYPK